jgi:hypothetical protein
MRLHRIVGIALPCVFAACASLVGFPDVPDIEAGDGGGRDAEAGGLDSPSNVGGDSSDFSLEAESSTTRDTGTESTGMTTSLTVVARVFGPASGMVFGPGGLLCTAPCTQTVTVPVGFVNLGVNGSGVWWQPSAGCSGGPCTLLVTGPTTVGVTFSGYNFVFASSLVHDGNMGGAAGADQVCAQAAAAAGLSGTFVSWIATSTTNPLTRLGNARGWIRPDGLPFADTPAGITNGQIFYPPAINEQWQPADDSYVYTGANVDGTIVNTQSNCNDFTSNASGVLGNGGASTGGTWVWTSGLAQGCNGAYPVYCFGTDLHNPLTFTPATGRHAFLSKGVFSPSSTISAADMLCRSEAASAHLSNPTHFLALLATTTATAASRFDLTGANWVRPDGIPITSRPSDIEQTLLAGISVHADGSYAANATLTGAYAPPPVATGATNPTTLGTSGSTCNDYSTSAGTSLAVTSAGYTTSWFHFSESACNVPLNVFCFEN